MINDPKYPNKAMPKWLLYALISKGVLALVITLGVLWYAGII